MGLCLIDCFIHWCVVMFDFIDVWFDVFGMLILRVTYGFWGFDLSWVWACLALLSFAVYLGLGLLFVVIDFRLLVVVVCLSCAPVVICCMLICLCVLWLFCIWFWSGNFGLGSSEGLV